MASLVADYGSESDNNSDVDDSSDFKNRDDMKQEKNTENPFFTESVSSSSSDEESENEKHTNSDSGNRLPNPLAEGRGNAALPRPRFLSSSSESVNHSVFINPFKKAEEAKLSVLEQHVKLTDAERIKRQKSKNVCNNFKKGRCHFGSKCKYRHTLELEKPDPDNEGQKPHTQHGYYGQHSYHANVASDEIDDDSYIGQAKRKHRAGIKDNLHPPKKAMKALEHERAKERPWTLNT